MHIESGKFDTGPQRRCDHHLIGVRVHVVPVIVDRRRNEAARLVDPALPQQTARQRLSRDRQSSSVALPNGEPCGAKDVLGLLELPLIDPCQSCEDGRPDGGELRLEPFKHSLCQHKGIERRGNSSAREEKPAKVHGSPAGGFAVVAPDERADRIAQHAFGCGMASTRGQFASINSLLSGTIQAVRQKRLARKGRIGCALARDGIRRGHLGDGRKHTRTVAAWRFLPAHTLYQPSRPPIGVSNAAVQPGSTHSARDIGGHEHATERLLAHRLDRDRWPASHPRAAHDEQRVPPRARPAEPEQHTTETWDATSRAVWIAEIVNHHQMTLAAELAKPPRESSRPVVRAKPTAGDGNEPAYPSLARNAGHCCSQTRPEWTV